MLDMFTCIFLASVETFFAGREEIVQGHRGEDIGDPAEICSRLLRSGVSYLRFPMV